MIFRREKLPPALKHAAYSATSILPGESLAEFEKLHQSLIADISPAGPLEEDIVATDMVAVTQLQRHVINTALTLRLR